MDIKLLTLHNLLDSSLVSFLLLTQCSISAGAMSLINCKDAIYAIAAYSA